MQGGGGIRPSPRFPQKGIIGLLDKVRARFKELFGHEPTADELFQKVSSGEIGQRASLGSAGGGLRFSMDELENLKASGLGLDSKTFANLQKLYKERYDRDLAKAQEKAERDQKKRQSAEWKDNRKSMREDVEQSIRQRPDIAVDQFLEGGTNLAGETTSPETLLVARERPNPRAEEAVALDLLLEVRLPGR